MTEETEDDKPIIHEPGIWFNLKDTEYHADRALGSSSIKAIATDSIEYQFDRLYGEDLDTDALRFGSGIHKRILEGRAALEAEFCHEFDKSLVKGALDTITELKAWLEEKGIKGLSGKKKDDLIAAVREIDPEQPIAAVIKAKWDAENEGKVMLPPKRWAQIETAARWLQRDPLLSAVMTDGTFNSGAPEVSVFYEDRGVRLKARFDRLLRHAIVDLKSFAPWFSGNLEGAAIKVIERMRYDIQAADYIRAWHKAKELYLEGRVFGEEPFEGFLSECFDRDEPKWIWIFVKSKGAPQPLVVDWQAKFAMRAAMDKVEHAIDEYIRLRDEFGEDNEWVPQRPALTIDDSSLPAYFGAN
jgi:hypothetical protein